MKAKEYLSLPTVNQPAQKRSKAKKLTRYLSVTYSEFIKLQHLDSERSIPKALFCF